MTENYYKIVSKIIVCLETINHIIDDFENRIDIDKSVLNILANEDIELIFIKRYGSDSFKSNELNTKFLNYYLYGKTLYDYLKYYKYKFDFNIGENQSILFENYDFLINDVMNID